MLRIRAFILYSIKINYIKTKKLKSVCKETQLDSWVKRKHLYRNFSASFLLLSQTFFDNLLGSSQGFTLF